MVVGWRRIFPFFCKRDAPTSNLSTLNDWLMNHGGHSPFDSSFGQSRDGGMLCLRAAVHEMAPVVLSLKDRKGRLVATGTLPLEHLGVEPPPELREQFISMRLAGRFRGEEDGSNFEAGATRGLVLRLGVGLARADQVGLELLPLRPLAQALPVPDPEELLHTARQMSILGARSDGAKEVLDRRRKTQRQRTARAKALEASAKSVAEAVKHAAEGTEPSAPPSPAAVLETALKAEWTFHNAEVEAAQRESVQQLWKKVLLLREGGPVFKSLRPGARPDGFERPEELTHDPRSGGPDPGDMSAELGAEELRELVRRCVASSLHCSCCRRCRCCYFCRHDSARCICARDTSNDE